MKYANLIDQKILTRPQLIQRVAQWRLLGKTIAFTNGVFDILHPGHIYSLSQAASEAEMLVVGLNADVSVKRLKGENRPVNVQDTRAIMMASLQIVDAVVLFEEDTPLELIKSILPDVLIKGGDYTLEQVVGAKEVMIAGGRVVINPLKEGFSTTSFIEQLKNT